MKSSMDLSKLAPTPGARKLRRRKGRGNASGLGGTSGKGHKGQKARAGGHVRPGFEGGQMPLYRRLPKFGFFSRKRILGLNKFNLINLSVLEQFETGTTVDPEVLNQHGYCHNSRCKAGIKVLGNGELTKKLNLKVHAISDAARAKVEAVGGKVELITK